VLKKTCTSCKRQVRELKDNLCLTCRIDLGLEPKKSTVLFLSAKDEIPILQPVIHYAHVVDTVMGTVTKAEMYCGEKWKDPSPHKFSFRLEEVTCLKCRKMFP